MINLLKAFCVWTFFILTTSAYGEEVPTPVDLTPHVCTPTEIATAVDLDKIDESGRIITNKQNQGQELQFILPKGASNSTKVTLKETKRRTRLTEDLITLSKIFGKITFAKTEEKFCVSYTPRYKRSTFEIAVTESTKGPESVKDKWLTESSKVDESLKGAESPKVTESTKGTKIYELTAGPKEHFYLSADMAVTNVKQLNYDSGTNSIIEKKKPGSFYIGLNYKIGDVFTNYALNDKGFLQNFSLKLLFKASSHPSESMGVGVGYTYKMAEIFVAQVSTKNEQNVGGSSLGSRPSTIFGISFNLSKGLEWLKQ